MKRKEKKLSKFKATYLNVFFSISVGIGVSFLGVIPLTCHAEFDKYHTLGDKRTDEATSAYSATSKNYQKDISHSDDAKFYSEAYRRGTLLMRPGLTETEYKPSYSSYFNYSDNTVGVIRKRAGQPRWGMVYQTNKIEGKINDKMVVKHDSSDIAWSLEKNGSVAPSVSSRVGTYQCQDKSCYNR